MDLEGVVTQRSKAIAEVLQDPSAPQPPLRTPQVLHRDVIGIQHRIRFHQAVLRREDEPTIAG